MCHGRERISDPKGSAVPELELFGERACGISCLPARCQGSHTECRHREDIQLSLWERTLSSAVGSMAVIDGRKKESHCLIPLCLFKTVPVGSAHAERVCVGDALVQRRKTSNRAHTRSSFWVGLHCRKSSRLWKPQLIIKEKGKKKNGKNTQPLLLERRI